MSDAYPAGPRSIRHALARSTGSGPVQQTRRVTTHERELTEPVDLCTPDGRRLNPAARGWSRQPLHRANLRGGWGRTKRWDYWAVLTEDVVVTLTIADVDYLGLAVVGWIDLRDHRIGGRQIARPLARGIDLPEVSGTVPLDVGGLAAVTGTDGTRLTATWTESDGRPAALDVFVTEPEGHESLNVVIPWSDRRFQFTSKHQARPAHGTLTVGDEVRDLDGGWGVLDVGRGRWPYRTRWNWAGGAGPATDGRTVGLQLGGKWTDGTGFTENGILVDGRLDKIGADLTWTYEWDRPLEPWRVTAPDGSVDLRLDPFHDRHEQTNAVVLRTEVHQVFGHWSGTAGEVTVDGLLGFAEESRSRW
jgi:hypothetical protein